MPDVNDPNNDKSRLESRKEVLDELPREESKSLRYWLNNFNDSYADSTTLAHLGHLLTLQEELEVPLIEADKMDWVAAISKLENDRGWTSGTKRNWQKSARSFLDEHDDAEASKDDISLAKDDSGGKIDEEDILSIEETRTLIYEASNRVRDQAMFAVLVDLGLRIAALCSLRIQDFEYEDGASVGEITLNADAMGQKGSGGRTHVATISSGFIRNYLRSEHPRSDDPDAPLFHKIGRHYDESDPDDDGSITPAIFRRRMRRLARDTDIDKQKLHPHNLKHAAVTIWALRGMSDREIEYRAGWARESGQLKRYEHLTGDDINDQILDTFGIEREKGAARSIAPIDACPNCGVSVDTGMRFCPQCGQRVEAESRPEWFVRCVEELTEEHALVAELLDSPSQITSDPVDLPQSILSKHQNTIEDVLGQSISYGTTSLDNQFDASIPRVNSDESVMVGVPFEVAQEYDVGELRAKRSSNGMITLVDTNGDVVTTVDPLGVE